MAGHYGRLLEDVSDLKGSRTLPANSGRPDQVASEAFREHWCVVYDSYTGKKIVLIDPDKHPWMQDTWSGEPRVEQDPRFADVLKQSGGKTGDPWVPYQVKWKSPTHAIVVFEEWNWWTWVHVERTLGRWEAVTVEADGEGNEDQPPLRWKVSKVGGRLEITRPN